MIRRRRPPREVPFSLDCFLDVITNVVGIIIRLILVAWVGARAYHAVLQALPSPPAAVALPASTDAEEAVRKTLSRQQWELLQVEQRVQTQGTQMDQLRGAGTATVRQLAQLTEEEQKLDRQRRDLIAAQVEKELANKEVTVSVAELAPRAKQLEEEIRKLQKEPSAKKPLRFRTPVSRVVQSEELHFECKDGRVAFVDLAAFLEDLKHDLQTRTQELRTQGRITGVANPLGAFELHYTLELQDDRSGAVNGSWQVVPIAAQRGETAVAALRPGSMFRQIVDRLDPEHTTVTFWVYPDSFALYRQLRDLLHRSNVEVAGRPLPEGTLIGASPNGRKSRGQ